MTPVQVTVVAIGAFMVQQWRGPPWNAPIWPMIPLLLNRSIEVAALCLKNVFTSITVSPCQPTPAEVDVLSVSSDIQAEYAYCSCGHFDARASPVAGRHALHSCQNDIVTAVVA